MLVLRFLGPRLALELRCLHRRCLATLGRALLCESLGQAPPSAEEACAHLLQPIAGVDDKFLSMALLAMRESQLLHARDVQQRTALMYAAQRGATPLVALLLEARADVAAKDCHGGAALNHAAWAGRPGATSLLLRARADVDAASSGCGKYTPLMAASRFGYHAVVSRLLAAGANASARTALGETALSLALHGGHRETAALLEGTDSGVDWRGGSMRHARGVNGQRQAQRAFDAELGMGAVGGTTGAGPRPACCS